METNSDYTPTDLKSGSKIFLIKNYSFNGSGTSGNTNYPYKLSEVTDLPGIRGQGNNNPKSYFADHAVVWYNGTYYDPSYGKTASNLINYRDNALDGWLDVDTGFVTNNVSKHNLVSK